MVMRPKVFFKKNGATILTCVGVVGVAATAVASAKATTKASYILEAAKLEKGEDLTTVEKIKIAGPSYIPAVLLGASTITCVLGANIINKRTQASLVSAYGVLNHSYKEYVDKVNELYGNEVTQKIEEKLTKDNCPRTR